MNTEDLDFYSLTDRGLKRPNNEDEAGFLYKEKGGSVLLVADGMGGHKSGEVASKIAKETILGRFKLEEMPESLFWAKLAIKKTIKKANLIIHRLSSREEQYYGMGTTLVMAIVFKESTIIVNCGDSRAYSYSLAKRKLTQLTTDQTVVEYLYKMGAITEEEIKTSPKRHVLMNALGIAPTVSYDLSIIPNDYDALLLCSDGLSNMVAIQDIEGTLFRLKDDTAETVTRTLIDEAKQAGGIDNIGVTFMEVKKHEDR
jgi:serine/threonine protein phosphatase PrpC